MADSPSLIMVDLAEAVEARAATDGPVSLVDAAVGRLSPVSVAGRQRASLGR